MMLGNLTVDTTKQVVSPILRAEAASVEILVLKEEFVPQKECSCVTFARTLLPELPLGEAKDLVPNSPYPRVGGVVIVNYDGRYHLAYIYDKVRSNGDIPLHDANLEPCRETWRVINIEDPRIVGYWSPVL